MKKLDVDVEINEEIDISAFFSSGKLQSDEKPLPEDEQTPPPVGGQKALPTLNQEIIDAVNLILIPSFVNFNRSSIFRLCRWVSARMRQRRQLS